MFNFNISKEKKQAYRIVIIFLVISLITFATTKDTNTHFTILGIASVLLILAIGRLRESSSKLIIFTVFLALFFMAIAPTLIKHFGLLIFLSLMPSYKTRAIKNINYRKYKRVKDELEANERSLSRRHERLRRTTKNLENEIIRYSRLYDVSKDIANVNSSEELAEKAFESLHLKINIERIAFYKLSRPGYKVFKTRNIKEQVANTWLEYIDDINNAPEDELFKFYLRAGKKNLGLIIFTGKLSNRQIKEAEILISQVSLGYEKTILYEQVKELSRLDSLTGMYLRKHFLKRLSEEMKRADRESYDIAFIMADLDNFKEYNDSHGHPMGDKVLKKVSSLIMNNIYSSDIAGRYGGEEFCIYMPMADSEGTIKKAEKLLQLIEKRSPVTTSIGIAYYPQNGTTPEELINAADKALYEAKDKGKNRIHQI